MHNAAIREVSLKQPINLIFDDNGVYVSYFNTKNLIFEIFAIEFYKSRMETSFTDLLVEYYGNKLGELTQTNYMEQETNVISFQQKFAFPLGVHYMTTFHSKKGLTRRNLIIITGNQQIYSLDRKFVSTRRPLTQLTSAAALQSFESTSEPQYAYLLPVSGLQVLSQGKSLHDIRKVEVFPSELESTSLMIAYGNDIYFNLIAPQKEFDSLNEGFEYGLIALSLIGAFVLTSPPLS